MRRTRELRSQGRRELDMLVEAPLGLSNRPLSEQAQELIARGRARFKAVDCFDFVPSDYELVWQVLGALPPGRLCEWGSGLGIVTGLAEILGFDAYGMEIDATLAEASRRLLAELELTATIETVDYFTSRHEADVYFVYCWPSIVTATEAHFESVAPRSAKLLICYGQSDIRCKVRAA